LLSDLDGACFEPLEPLPESDAVELLARIAGPEQVAGAASAAISIVNACGRLPLAVRIAGARALRGSGTLTRLADQLADGARLLDHLTSAERSVRASLRSAYDTLDGPEQRLLRRLATATVDDFPAWIADVALDAPAPTGRAVLDGLVRAGLVEALEVDSVGQWRYRLHDVVRHFAAEQAAQPDASDEQPVILERIADAWNTLAEEADKALNQLASPDAVVTTARVPAVTGAHLADVNKWFELECPSIVDLARRAATTGLHVQCWNLIWNCETYLQKDARATELISLGHLGLDAAERAADPLGVACMSLLLAASSYDLATTADTAEHHANRALAGADAIGHTWLRAETYSVLADIHASNGRATARQSALRQAIELYLEAGELTSAGTRLTQLGELAAQAGDEDTAAEHYERGVALLRQVDAPVPLARGLRRLATSRFSAGATEVAADLYQQCLALLQEAGEPIGELCIHTELGLALIDLDQLDEATSHIDRAMALSEQVTDVPTYPAYARLGRAVLLARHGRTDEARTDLLEAVPALSTMPTAQTTALIRLSRIHRQAGDDAAADEAGREAARIAEQIGATRLAQQARAATVPHLQPARTIRAGPS
jgi:tetratricopeptide (TPR) repeat protein